VAASVTVAAVVLVHKCIRERIWMSQDNDSTSSHRTKWAQQKQSIVRTEAKHRVVTRHHQKRLERHSFNCCTQTTS